MIGLLRLMKHRIPCVKFYDYSPHTDIFLRVANFLQCFKHFDNFKAYITLNLNFIISM